MNIEVGSSVRIANKKGRPIYGTVTSVSTEEVVVKWPTKYEDIIPSSFKPEELALLPKKE